MSEYFSHEFPKEASKPFDGTFTAAEVAIFRKMYEDFRYHKYVNIRESEEGTAKTDMIAYKFEEWACEYHDLELEITNSHWMHDDIAWSTIKVYEHVEDDTPPQDWGYDHPYEMLLELMWGIPIEEIRKRGLI